MVQDGHIVLAQDGHRVELMPLESIPFTLEGRVRFQVQNALAATAALGPCDVPRLAIPVPIEAGTCVASRHGSTVLSAMKRAMAKATH